MDPTPVPDPPPSPTARWVSLVLTVGLFALSVVLSCVRGEVQGEQMRRQGEDIRAIKAMLEEQRSTRSAPPGPERR